MEKQEFKQWLYLTFNGINLCKFCYQRIMLASVLNIRIQMLK